MSSRSRNALSSGGRHVLGMRRAAGPPCSTRAPGLGSRETSDGLSCLHRPFLRDGTKYWFRERRPYLWPKDRRTGMTHPNTARGVVRLKKSVSRSESSRFSKSGCMCLNFFLRCSSCLIVFAEIHSKAVLIG